MSRRGITQPFTSRVRVQVWVDGVQVYHIGGLQMRVKDSVKIRGMVFSTFFAGANPTFKAAVDCATYYRKFVYSVD